MAAITTLDQFTGIEAPLATDWGILVGSGLNEGSGVCSPPAYNADHGSYFDAVTGPSTADHRVQVKLTFTTADFSPFALAVRIQDTNNYYYVKFSPGSDENGWSTPDTVKIIKKVSGSDTTITPTNTANGTSLYRAIIDSDADGTDDAISLRDVRVQSGDIFEVQIIDDQILVKVNHIIVAHEAITGIDAAGDIGLINFSGAGDNTYDDFKGGDMVGRYVNGADANASNSNTGLSPSYVSGTNGPWKTLQYGLDTQAAGEVVFVLAHTYADGSFIITSTMPTRSTFEEPVILIKKAGEAITESTRQFIANANSKGYGILYGLRFRGVGLSINQNQYDTNPFIIHGCSIVDNSNDGIAIGRGPGSFIGGHYVLDCFLQGNGRQAGSLKHQMYVQSKNNTIKYNTIDGSSFASGTTSGLGIQLYYAAATVGSPTGYTDSSKFNYNVVRNHDGVNGTNIRGGILLGAGASLECKGNYVHDNHRGINLFYALSACRVQSNVCANNNQEGILIDSSTAVNVTNSLLYNNTCYRNGTFGIRLRANSVSTVVKNNLLYQNGTSPYSDAEDYTDNGTTTSYSAAENWLTSDGDPGFVSAATGNFAMASSGGAATGAVDLTGSGVTADILGYVIPQAGAPTDFPFGAYVFPDPAVAPIVTMDPTASITINVATTFSISVEGQGNVGNVALINWDGNMTATIGTPGSATVRGPA